jgi:hypothetical protein
VVFAEVLLQVAPRRNHAIEAGPQAISRDRLTVHAGRAAQPGGETIHAALDAALRLSQPDPQFLALADLADQLARHADSDEPTAA